MLLQSNEVEVEMKFGIYNECPDSGLFQEITATLNELEQHQNVEVSFEQIQIKGIVYV